AQPTSTPGPGRRQLSITPQPPRPRSSPFQGHRVASLGRRLAARILDLLIVDLPLSAILGVALPLPDGDGLANNYERSASISLIWWGSAALLLLDLYNRGYREGVTGQSWGKRALRIRVVSTTDNEPDRVEHSYPTRAWPSRLALYLDLRVARGRLDPLAILVC